MKKKRQRSSSDSVDKTSKSPIEIVVAKYGLIGTVITALLGLCGLVVTGYFTYLATRTQVFGTTDITRTAEAGLLVATAEPTTPAQEATLPAVTQSSTSSTRVATEIILAPANDAACFYYQDEAQTPVEVLAETLKYSGSSQLQLANGEKIPFKDITRFELIQITAGNHAQATVTLADGTSFTQELKYGDSSFSGTTYRGELSLNVDQVKQIVFGASGSCQPSQTALSTPIATRAPVTEAHEVACIYYQDTSQPPVEALAETLRFFGNRQLSFTNGEKIPFTNIARFELLQITGNQALATLTLSDGTALTQELRYEDSRFSGSTERGEFTIPLEDVKRIIFGAIGSCQ